MGAGKTHALLGVAANYEAIGRRVLVVGAGPTGARLASRAGAERTPDVVVEPGARGVPSSGAVEGVACVLVDEAQFLGAPQVDRLRELARRVPVICYGLRTDWRGQLFEGSRRLLEVADTIEEVKTICAVCGERKATHALRDPAAGGELVVPDKALYRAACWPCWAAARPAEPPSKPQISSFAASAYAQGVHAAKAGRPAFTNPHAAQGPLEMAEAWLDGWTRERQRAEDLDRGL